MPPAASLAFVGLREFISTLDAKWLNDFQEFIHAVLPKLVVIAVGGWVLARLLSIIPTRMVSTAERHAAGIVRIAQVRTLAQVLRATGIGAIVALVVLLVLDTLHFNLGPLLASAGVAGVALGLAAQTIVKHCLNGVL